MTDARTMHTCVLVTLVFSASALQLPSAPTRDQLGRRSLLSGAAVAALVLPGVANAALKPCPSGANNCFSAAGSGKNAIPKWSFPEGMSKADATATLKEVLAAYPQAGQDGVDGGGWSLAEDNLAAGGSARYEFKSRYADNIARVYAHGL